MTEQFEFGDLIAILRRNSFPQESDAIRMAKTLVAWTAAGESMLGTVVSPGAADDDGNPTVAEGDMQPLQRMVGLMVSVLLSAQTQAMAEGEVEARDVADLKAFMTFPKHTAFEKLGVMALCIGIALGRELDLR